MRILGVDPGLQTTGYGVIRVGARDATLMEGGVVRGGSASRAMEQRLTAIYGGIAEVLADHSPEALALEKVYTHYRYPATAVAMAHARGVIVLAAADKGVPVFDYAATHVKLALAGSGAATKVQVQRAVKDRLGLSSVPEPNDVADALALAICHWQTAASRQVAQQAARMARAGRGAG